MLNGLSWLTHFGRDLRRHLPAGPVFYERRGRISLALERYRQRVYIAALPANWRELARFQAQRGIVASRPRKANSRARQVRT
jgi:hypothetical protein